MQYFLKNINNYTDNFYQYNYKLLNVYQKRKINQLKNVEDKKLSLLGLILVAQELNINIKDIHYKKKKPYIKNKNLYFSITHKYPYVGIVVSHTPVGIDIETIRDVDKNTLEYLNCANSLDALIKWTRKESLIKCQNKKNIKF